MRTTMPLRTQGSYRRLLTLLMTLALVAAACGSNGDANATVDVAEQAASEEADSVADEVEDAVEAVEETEAAEAEEAAPEEEDEAAPEEEVPDDEVEQPRVFDIIRDSSETTSFENAIAAMSISLQLADDGPFTVLAANNDNFLDLIAPLMLLDQGPQRATFRYHVILGEVPAADLVPGASFDTLADETLVIGDDGTLPGGFSIVEADLEAANGLVHIIDGVLIPPSVLPVLAE